MGKGKKHDRLYVTATEHSGIHGAHGASVGRSSSDHSNKEAYRALPFDYCGLSLQPLQNPIMDKRDATCFELDRLVPWIKSYGINPISGNKLTLDDDNLVKVKFWKNAQGEPHCPVTFSVFNEHSHIVVIIPSRLSATESNLEECNVFSWEAVERLNIKTRSWRDLVTDVPFERDDIMTIQDPQHRDNLNRDLSQFYYIQNEMEVPGMGNEADNPAVNLEAIGGAKKVIQALPDAQKTEKPQTKIPKQLQSNISTGRTAASLTSTAAPISTKAERATYDPLEVMFNDFRENRAFPVTNSLKTGKVHPAKTYVRLLTSLGDINVELHSDKVPKTVWNFVTLAKRHYYDTIPFHRNIPNFMIQGGSNREGTGRGGESAFPGGEAFEDELTGRAKELEGHSRRGVMSMANSGPNSNRSQFFFTYGPTRHLDGKHTVFGQIVGGFDVLDKMEAFPTNSKDSRPKGSGIVLKEIEILIDPFDKYDAKMKRKEEREQEADHKKNSGYEARQKKDEDRLTWLGTELPNKGPKVDPAPKVKVSIGKYIKKSQESASPASHEQASKKVKLDIGNGFGDFSSW